MRRLYYILLGLVFFSGCVPNPNSDQVVTFQEYQQVKTDMTLSQVETLIGASGEPKSGSGTDAQFVWMNRDGTGLVVAFKNGKSYAKRSIGNIQ